MHLQIYINFDLMDSRPASSPAEEILQVKPDILIPQQVAGKCDSIICLLREAPINIGPLLALKPTEGGDAPEEACVV